MTNIFKRLFNDPCWKENYQSKLQIFLQIENMQPWIYLVTHQHPANYQIMENLIELVEAA